MRIGIFSDCAVNFYQYLPNNIIYIYKEIVICNSFSRDSQYADMGKIMIKCHGKKIL